MESDATGIDNSEIGGNCFLNSDNRSRLDCLMLRHLAGITLPEWDARYRDRASPMVTVYSDGSSSRCHSPVQISNRSTSPPQGDIRTRSSKC